MIGFRSFKRLNVSSENSEDTKYIYIYIYIEKKKKGINKE